MKEVKLHIAAKILLYWYVFIFISTEVLSYLHLLDRKYILASELVFWVALFYFFGKEIIRNLLSIDYRSKIVLIIIVLFTLTFFQGFFSAPSTTDSMVYHIPRIMYWMQNKTLDQSVIRSPHDFMAPFAEYILLHLYFIAGNDRFLFFSQWISYIVLVILSSVIAERLEADRKIQVLTSLFVATIPIVVMQASSTQIDMIVNILVVISSYLALMLLEKITLKNVFLFALAIGLGISTKATFFPFLIIPGGIILFVLIKNHWRKSFIIILTGLISLIMPTRFMSQNLYLYGNILGPLEGNQLVLTNEVIDLKTLSSNLIRNIMIHLPIPVFATKVQNSLESIHRIIGISINDPKITCCGFKFTVLPVIYPQEDIVSNTFHLLIIFMAAFFVFKKLISRRKSLLAIYFLSIFSFITFSLILKWQPFHSRLQIPFFVMGTISSVIILSQFKKTRIFLNVTLFLSVLLAFLVIILNVSRPYIPYSLFFNNIKSFVPQLGSIPEPFYKKLRLMQYFNARYYWYEPYSAIVSKLSQNNQVKAVSFNLVDYFEYPFWVLMREKDINLKVIPISQIDKGTILIFTAFKPIEKKDYESFCFKTSIDYGYACLLEPEDK